MKSKDFLSVCLIMFSILVCSINTQAFSVLYNEITPEASTEDLLPLSDVQVEVVSELAPEGGFLLSIPVPLGLPTNNIPNEYYSLSDPLQIELRTNSILDEIVAQYETNALALYEYVLNHIDYRSDPAVSDKSIRGSLGCYLEREGSSVDLASLTIYLLRRCGIPCAYGFLPAPSLMLEDWYQIYGFEVSEPDPSYYYSFPGTTQTIVYAYISSDGITTNWAPLVPWFKSRKLIEGIEFRDILTNDYQSGYGIVKKYLKRDSSIQEYVTNTSDLVMDFLPELLADKLNETYPEIALDELGSYWRPIDQNLDTWPDSVDIQLASGKVASASATLPDSFRKRMSLTLKKDTGGVLFTNTFYTVGLHNRRVSVSFEPATASDWLQITNGFYEAGTNFAMVGTLSFSPTKQFRSLVITGSLAQTVRMGDDLSLYADGEKRNVKAGSYQSLVFNFGRVTEEMVEMHYRELGDLSVMTKTTENLTWGDIDKHVLLGEQLCAVGMNYYCLADKMMRRIEEWTKCRGAGSYAVGSVYMNVATNTTGSFLADSMVLDMFSYTVFPSWYVHRQSSSTNGIYRSEEPSAQERDCYSLISLSSATLEHGVLKRIIGSKDSMSADLCLRLTVEDGGFVTNLTSQTYSQPQNKLLISNVNPNAYANVANFFENSPDGEAFFPSSSVINGTFTGYGWVAVDILTNNLFKGLGYLIKGGNHGGWSGSYEYEASDTISFTQTGDNTVYVSSSTSQDNLISSSYQSDFGDINFVTWNESSTIDYISSYANTLNGSVGLNGWTGINIWGAASDRNNYWGNASDYLGIGLSSYGDYFGSSDASVLDRIFDSGYHDYGIGSDNWSIWNTVADPVDTRTGEFYVDDLDLYIPGTKPIEFRRSYSSQYGAVGEFGFGWRFNHAAFLSINADKQEIRAVEPDGTIIRYTNSDVNVWSVSAEMNERLANQNNRGIGSAANPFINRIEKTIIAEQTNFTLYSANGETRRYTVQSFEDSQLTRNRPWLTEWSDANGNTLYYSYGTDASRVDYGKIIGIKNSHHFVKMNYNAAGRLQEVFCDDGRLLRYTYNPAGDLISVKRPDGSFVEYEYDKLYIPRRFSIDLDGENDYASVAHSSSYLFSTGLTIEAWIKVDAAADDWVRVIGKGASESRNYALWIAPDGDVMFQIHSASGIHLNLWNDGGPGDSANISAGSGWHHIAGTYNGSSANLYVDGNSVASTAYSQTPYATDSPFTIGYAGYHACFDGEIDDVLLWGCERTASQIQTDYEYTPDGTEAGLVGAWCFDNENGEDLSPVNNSAQFYDHARVVSDDATYSSHLIVRELKPGGQVLENIYDDQRRVIEQNATVGLSAIPVQNASFAYIGDGLNGMTIVSNVFGDATTYVYSNGLVISVTDSLGYTESNQWDEAHNLISHTDKRGTTTRYHYDITGNATNVLLIGDVTGNGTVSTSVTWYTYTSKNLVASKTSPKGDVLRFYYDQSRNLVEKQLCYSDSDPWNPTNNAVYRSDIYQYDSRGLMTNAIIAASSVDESVTALVYNDAGHLIQSRMVPGFGQQEIMVNYEVNDRGWVTKKTVGSGAYTTYDYDAMGRVLTEIVYGSDHTKLKQMDYEYDENGNVLKEFTPRTALDDTIYRTYDRMNRMVTQKQKRYDVGLVGGFPVYSYAGDAVTTLIYDEFGNLKQKEDPNGNVTKHQYDVLGQKTYTTNYQGSGDIVLSDMRHWYDAAGQNVSNRTPRGYTLHTVYNASGKPVQKQYEDGSTEYWWYDISGLVTQHMEERGVFTQFYYDDFGRLTNRIEAAGTGEAISYAYTYDLRGNTLSTKDPQGYVTSNVYDFADRVVIEYGPEGVDAQSIFSNCYDGAGNLISRISSETITTNTYDGLGRLVQKEIYHHGGIQPDIKEDYDYTLYELNDVRRILQSDAEIIEEYLDEAGRVGAVFYNDQSVVTYRYDLNGNKDQHIDEINQVTTYSYDGLNRLLTKTTPDNVTIYNAYDAAGNLTNTLYPNSIQYSMTYDARNRMLSEEVTGNDDEMLFRKTIDYDAAGNVITQTSARGITISSEYNALGRKTSVRAISDDPFTEDIEITMQYTLNGWVQSLSSDGYQIYRQYNQTGQVIAETNIVGDQMLSSIQSFDSEGRRTMCMVEPAGEQCDYQWNGAGRVTNITWDGVDYRITYNAVNNLQAIHTPVMVMTNDWWYRHRLLRRVYWYEPSSYWTYSELTSYRPDGQCTNQLTWRSDLYNYMNSDYAYDNRNRLTNENVFAGGSSWITNAYTYDASELRTSQLKSTPTGMWQRTAGADSLHRLVSESTTTAGTNPVITVSGQALYTTNIQIRLNGQPVGYAEVDTNTHIWTLSDVQLVGGSNQITAVADQGELWASNAVSTLMLNLYVRGSYAYDADGNLVYVNRGNKDYAYQYDALGRLAKSTMRDANGNGWNWTAGYDPLGRRVKTTYSDVTGNQVAGTNEKYILCDPLYPMQELVHIETAAGGSTNFFLYGPDLSDTIGGLGGIGGLLATRQDGHIYHILVDMRGNVVATVDNSSRYYNPWYSAFGMLGESSSPADTPTFASRWTDNTGLIYMGARYYDPVTGMFLSPDPMRFLDSRNLYAYVNHNPMVYIDPWGLCKGGFNENFETWTGGLEINDAIKLYKEQTGNDISAKEIERMFTDPDYANERLLADQSLHSVEGFRGILNQNAPVRMNFNSIPDGWTKLPWYKSIFHNPWYNPWKNSKYVGPGGHMEGVYDSMGNWVNDIKYIATFNFFGPGQATEHIATDVAPFNKWGN